MRTADLLVTSSCHNSPLVRHFGGGSPTRESLLCNGSYYAIIGRIFPECNPFGEILRFFADYSPLAP